MKSLILKRVACSVLAAAVISSCWIPVAPVSVKAESGTEIQSEMSFQDQVVYLVNQERALKGLEPLYAVPVMIEAADLRSDEIKEKFSHTRPDGSSCFTVLPQFGIKYLSAGENIAAGYTTPESVMKGWMNSEGHRANILNANFKYIGVGYEKGNYWTQIFIGGVTRDDGYLPEKSEALEGDVDGNGKIDANDAAEILVQSAGAGAGQKDHLNQDQIAVADVNSDKDVDAKDASIVLKFSAFNATTTFGTSIRLFMDDTKPLENASIGEACMTEECY